jgi:hypothetical protein
MEYVLGMGFLKDPVGNGTASFPLAKEFNTSIVQNS